MDIQNEQGNENGKNRSSSLNGHRMSIKSRKSNQSCFSIGGTHYYDHPSADNQKISLQSNISNKAKEKFNNKDLFEQMAYEESYLYEMKDQGSLRNRQRFTEGEKIEIQGQKMSIEPQPSSKQSEISCKCPKSKCLLMYCECFSKGLMCNEKCSCYQCRNNPDFEDKRQMARKAVLQKDQNAFTNKIQLIGGQKSQFGLKKGCNCKKTGCIKKYCECFFTGVKCSYLCNCENCLNGGVNSCKHHDA